MKQPLSQLNHHSPIEFLTNHQKNYLYIKREDLLSFSFGGNKSRKALYFINEILKGKFDAIVTYGSSQSNHCRVIANLCTKYNLYCWIISPHANDVTNVNRKLVNLSGANIIECSISEVPFTIQDTMARLKQNKYTPYFIPGGGHHNLGTQAYVDAYTEIVEWEKKHNISFDYIFLASGTGTTQAGLIMGTILHNHLDKKVIGISIAREADYGTEIINQSIQEYIAEQSLSISTNFRHHIHFYDHYVNRQYGETTPTIRTLIQTMYHKHGIAFSGTYTAKAFQGMKEYISQNSLSQKKILFLHTGAIPLFFNDLDIL